MGIGGEFSRSCASRLSFRGQRFLYGVSGGFAKSSAVIGLLLAALCVAIPLAQAQVALDASTSASGGLTRAANTLTFAHTTTGTNPVLVVGVSTNISAKNTTTVSGVTYNGVALTSAGTAVTNNNRRTELWYLTAPALGNNPVVVTLSIPSGGNPTIGVVAGAVTFTGADQTTPIRTGSYVTNTGNSANAFINVASSPNDMVMDTLTLFSGTTAASSSAAQVQQWAMSSGGSGQDAYGFGSIRQGAASVPISENLSASAQWSDAAASIQPAQADVSIALTGSTSKYPAAVTYTVTVKNAGPSAATGVVATLTLPSGLTLVSATPSQGSCSGTTSITCSLGSIAKDGNVTISVSATPSAPGGYVLSGTVSSTSADLNNSNNSADGVAYSEFTSCATTTATAGGTLTGVINTYYPGTATASAGSTSITLGAATGAASQIQAGDLVLVMQMQDAAINTSNSSLYGDGIDGSGWTSLNNAGVYEYATAVNALPLAGGTLTVAASGPAGGLLYTYTSAAASSSQGARTFQVIRVPNYLSATLSSTLTASAWNGSTGGVLALNVSGTLTLNNAAVSVSGLGFRGGPGMQLNGTAAAANTDYIFPAPSTYNTTTLTATAGAHGVKGEGIAGTPEWVENVTGITGGVVTAGTVASTGQTYAEGYPLGSMARGAPANAGGGGTDSHPINNDENTGGGGGANGGAGGQGGNSWNTNLALGGLGGTAFPASSSRVVMGGGGGAGTSNNNSNFVSSSGAPGGGIVMIRAASISGTVTINANGLSAYNSTPNDGGGGGGAGGSIVFLWSGIVGTPAVTLNANGGRGGDAWDAGAFNNGNRHGPGGGGGGGAVLYTGTGTSMTSSITGGANAITLNTANVSYGAASGSDGVRTAGVTLDSSPGPRSASACTDVSVTKSGAPDPVIVNNTLTYTITVTNNSATNAATALSVVDSIPAEVTYVSSSVSGGVGGICTQAAGILTCTFTSLAASSSATITVVTTATTPYSMATNTVIVNQTTPDPNAVNNTATAAIPIEGPTSVRVNSFSAMRNSAGVLIAWSTGGELHNLGFNVYRDVNGYKTQLNPSLIAGSALMMREALEQHGAKSYGWIDPSPSAGALYWLEDVDLNGTRTVHGPVSVQSASQAVQSVAKSIMRTTTLQDLAQPATRNAAALGVSAGSTLPRTRIREAVATPVITPARRQTGFALAARAAVKIHVDHEGWYRVTQPQLAAAGLPQNADARSLHLYAEGAEQAIRVTGGEVFGAQSAIEFYGTAIDTPYSGQRVYWLTWQGQAGQRIHGQSENGTAIPAPNSFWQTVELKPRTTYFAALLREDTDNFFGPLVSSTSTTQTLNIANLAQGQAIVDVVLQGVTDAQQHQVTVVLNGNTLGDVNFANQQEGRARFTVPSGILINGANAVTLTAQQGSNDISLIDYIDVSYPHTYTAESNQLKFSASSGAAVTVAGFSVPPTTLIDITNPQQPVALRFQTSTSAGTYVLTAQVPMTSSGTHWLLALADLQVATPVTLAPHHPSNSHSTQRGAEIVLLTAPQFASEFEPVADLRRAEGKSVAVVNVDDVYDEFNFGERTPYAIREFLRMATAEWKQKPRYLLLGGDASVDPRNYLGFGYLDFVPTKIIVTQELKTASDDWFSDFNNTGFAAIATGRLPARTTRDAQTIASKILGYASGQPGSWINDSLLIADVDDPGVNFTQAAQAIQKTLPQNMSVTGVFTTAVGVGTARQQILSAMNAGQLLVNYNGHGSVQIWGSNLFDDTAASALTNSPRLPFVVAMNCLNGFFHDVYTQSLATALMLSANGGAVAVWASSGLTAPTPQFQMDQALVKTLSNSPGISIGDAITLAKSGIADQDVRRTFILFGDPSMRLKWPQSAIPNTHLPNALSFQQTGSRLQNQRPLPQ